LKDQLDLLRNLQAIDLDLDGREGSVGQIRKQLEDHKLILAKLAADLESQKSELKDTIALKSQREVELADSDSATARSKERLMNVSSAKEYNALEKEIEVLSRKSEETREQLDHLREAIDVNERAITDKESKIEALREQIDGAEKEAEGQLAQLEASIAGTRSKRNAARESIKAPIMRRYDFIRKRRGGSAVCPAIAGACQGCFMMLPPQQFIVLQRGQTLVTCPSCQRILFFEDPAAEATAN
jgi:uncharacterized protein